MTRKLRRGKSKVYTPTPQVLPRYRGKGQREEQFLDTAHEDHHLPRILVYTSAATLSTTASTPIRPPRGGRIVAVHLNVAGAPSGANFKHDTLIAGATIFPDGDLPEILDGEVTSGHDSSSEVLDDPRHPGDMDGAFNAFDAIQSKCDTISSATGPLVVQYEIDWED